VDEFPCTSHVESSQPAFVGLGAFGTDTEIDTESEKASKEPPKENRI